MMTRLIAMLALTMALGAPAVAQVPPRRPVPARPARVAQSVQVQLMVVHANNRHTRVDERLEALRAHLRHLDYTGYDVLQTQSETLSDGQEAQYSIAGNREVKVQLVDHDDENGRLRILVFNSGRKVLETTVSVRRNRSFIVMGPNYDGGVLILPITVRY